MASYIASEPRAQFVSGPESARTHGVEGVRSLYRCLRQNGLPEDDDGVVMDVAIRKQLEGKSQDFRLGATAFCECSGVV